MWVYVKKKTQILKIPWQFKTYLKQVLKAASFALQLHPLPPKNNACMEGVSQGGANTWLEVWPPTYQVSGRYQLICFVVTSAEQKGCWWWSENKELFSNTKTSSKTHSFSALNSSFSPSLLAAASTDSDFSSETIRQHQQKSVPLRAARHCSDSLAPVSGRFRRSKMGEPLKTPPTAHTQWRHSTWLCQVLQFVLLSLQVNLWSAVEQQSLLGTRFECVIIHWRRKQIAWKTVLIGFERHCFSFMCFMFILLAFVKTMQSMRRTANHLRDEMRQK